MCIELFYGRLSDAAVNEKRLKRLFVGGSDAAVVAVLPDFCDVTETIEQSSFGTLFERNSTRRRPVGERTRPKTYECDFIIATTISCTVSK